MPPSRTSSMQVSIKHGGKTLPIEVDLNAPATAFKASIQELTSVPAERMKVMIKGILKDDADMSKLGLKAGQVITVIGSAEMAPVAPAQAITFIEDMDDSELAQASGTPPGLVNLVNTCYLNSSLQVMRAMPQLSEALDSYSSPSPTPEARLTTSIKNLFSGMKQTTDAISPFALLANLRTINPQFGETDNHGIPAQQDADEAWTQLLSALRGTLPAQSGQTGGSFVEDMMTVELTKTLTCPEAPEEAPSTSKETSFKLECNISITTNFLISGILDSLDQQIEKNSPTLNRSAVYNAKARVSRLPEYLTVHMVRFYWRRDIQKKAKIMRKVKFPLQLDLSDIVTDDLRTTIQPINTAVKNILKTRDDRARVMKRSKDKGGDGKEEEAARAGEKEEVKALVDAAGGEVRGINASGMYELCAMVTHKGASADSGHYIGWARNDTGTAYVASGEEEWYKFDDDKVSIVSADKILSMDGGGEDSVAYILLYRAVNI